MATQTATEQQGAQSRPNQTDRPTLAGFGAMLANAAQDFGTIRHNNGEMDVEATAKDVIERISDLAGELLFFDISAPQICALMEIVNNYAVTVPDTYRRNKAKQAAEALCRVVTIWGLLKDYKPELYHLDMAFANYASVDDTAK